MTGIEWIVLLLVVLLGAYAFRRSASPGSSEESWLPRELTGASLVYAERRFVSQRLGLIARIDRAYCSNGHLTLVELKTRAFFLAYESDIIELSVQRLAVQDETGDEVEPTAFVLVRHSQSESWRTIPVSLLDEPAVMELVQRYQTLRGGQFDNLRPAHSPTMCAQCGHFDHCATLYGDRKRTTATAFR